MRRLNAVDVSTRLERRPHSYASYLIQRLPRIVWIAEIPYGVRAFISDALHFIAGRSGARSLKCKMTDSGGGVCFHPAASHNVIHQGLSQPAGVTANRTRNSESLSWAPRQDAFCAGAQRRGGRSPR
jgi:hypothetical protein